MTIYDKKTIITKYISFCSIFYEYYTGPSSFFKSFRNSEIRHHILENIESQK